MGNIPVYAAFVYSTDKPLRKTHQAHHSGNTMKTRKISGNGVRTVQGRGAGPSDRPEGILRGFSNRIKVSTTGTGSDKYGGISCAAVQTIPAAITATAAAVRRLSINPSAPSQKFVLLPRRVFILHATRVKKNRTCKKEMRVAEKNRTLRKNHHTLYRDAKSTRLQKTFFIREITTFMREIYNTGKGYSK